MRISKSFLKKGLFWLPSIKKEVKGALLIYDGGKIRLQLENLLLGPTKDENSIISLIHGRLEKVNVTLIDSYCQVYNDIDSAMQGGYLFEMHVGEAVIGGLFESPNIELQEATFSIEGIDDWIRQVKFPSNNNQTPLSKNSALSLKINKNNCLFKIKMKDSESLYDVQKNIKIIMLFFCFVFNKVVNLKKLSISSGTYKNLSVYYESIPFKSKKITADFMNPEDMGDLLGTIKKWFDFYASFFPALNLYFSFLTNSHTFAETKFIALSQALEAFHRLSEYDQNDLDPDEFDKLKMNILTHCSSDKHKEWLTSQFTYLNKINLRKRIKELIKPFSQNFGTSKQRSDLIDDIVDTRNKLTHLTIENMQKVYSKDMMIELCLKMDIMLSLLILSKLGFSQTDINKIVKYEPIQFKLNWKENPK